VVPFEEIAELAPGKTTEGDLQVAFKHQLTPIKLAVIMNEKTYPVKLTPEVGALLRPFQMTRNEFTTAQSRISGMHESSRRCASILPYNYKAIPTCALVIRHVCQISLNCLRVYTFLRIFSIPCLKSKVEVNSNSYRA
jgi:hypothetical protein